MPFSVGVNIFLCLIQKMCVHERQIHTEEIPENVAWLLCREGLFALFPNRTTQPLGVNLFFSFLSCPTLCYLFSL